MDDLKKLRYVSWFGWVALLDWQKAQRWLEGKQKKEPKFTYTVCKSITDVKELLFKAKSATLMAQDIETSGVLISSIAYTLLINNRIETYCIPIIYTVHESGAYWLPVDEAEVWSLIRELHLTDAAKVWQNGIYDNAYMVKYRTPVKNYFIDPLHLFHSIWCEAPKRLDFITSLFVDHYRYWKDEGKEDAKDDKDKRMLPRTAAGYQDYWRYNSLDTYFTLLVAIALVKLVSSNNLKWALDNYHTEMSLQTGPLLMMSVRGIHCNRDIRNELGNRWEEEAEKARDDLLTMVANPDFNPNSPQQVAQLVYDILQAKPIPRAPKRTTGEPYLKMIQTQHPIYERIIDQIWATKKPANNASKYGQIPLLNNRLMYQMSVSTTPTGRLASKKGQFWIGTNIQNIPKTARCMLEPDEGYVLWDIDYAQSDCYFTAFNSQDPTYMEIMLDDRDTHCFHAAHFFKRPYEEVYAGHIANEAWVSDPLVGIRQLTKRIVYGLNYLMTAHTLFMTMGKREVVAAALALGFTDAHLWSDKKLINLCQHFSNEYFKLYPWLLTSLRSDVETARQTGNKFTCAFGRTRLFLSDLNVNKSQREFAANIGQGGTAGNINKGLRTIWEQRLEEKTDSEVLAQVHDSAIGQTRIESLHKITIIQAALENTCEIKGKSFVVPTDVQVGLGWGKRLMPYTKDLTYEQIVEHDNKWKEKFYA